MATVTIEYFGMHGQGRNVTEAKRDAGSKIEAAIKGDYTPYVVSHRGMAVLIYRDPLAGWCDKTICYVDTGLVQSGAVYGSHGGPESADRDERIRMVRLHVAQQTWTAADGTEAPAFVQDRGRRDDFRRWAEFQLRYRDAKANGLSDMDAHSYAGRNPTRPDLWAHGIGKVA